MQSIISQKLNSAYLLRMYQHVCPAITKVEQHSRHLFDKRAKLWHVLLTRADYDIATVAEITLTSQLVGSGTLAVLDVEVCSTLKKNAAKLTKNRR